MSSLSRRVKEALIEARQSPAYVVERLKVRFAVALEQRRKASGMSYSDLAKRLETSPAYVTKLFRGDSNLTIETMVKLAMATNSDLDIRLVAASATHSSWDLEWPSSSSVSYVTSGASTFSPRNDLEQTAANHTWFSDLVARAA